MKISVQHRLTFFLYLLCNLRSSCVISPPKNRRKLLNYSLERKKKFIDDCEHITRLLINKLNTLIPKKSTKIC